MWRLQDTFRQLRSVPGAILDLFYDRAVAKYRPLEAQGTLYIPPKQQSGSSSSLLHSKARRWLCGAVTFLIVIVLIFLAYFSRKRFALDQSEHEGVSTFGSEHAILQLVRNAETQFQSCKAAQSTTLQEAVEEYQRRHHMPPPPHFDEWYHFALRHNTEMIDEYDAIHDSLVLFWRVRPAIIRKRAREALGYDNSLMGVSIRKGKITVIGSGQGDFQATATKNMISPFARWLPDMDLAFNVHDEPRVVIPHEDVKSMMSLADVAINSVTPRTSTFTQPNDLNNGKAYDPVTETTFVRLDHQQTWSHARMSCEPDTSARSFDPDVKDAETMFSFGLINFIYNVTTFSDICLSPSVRHVIGLFNHPNAFAVSHDLVPVFSPSRLSSFHDILYPSPYYYADKAAYEPNSAVKWDDKTPKMYWHGTTSGGYSEGGTWRTLLRQSILSKLLLPGSARVLRREHDGPNKELWSNAKMPGSEVAHLYDAQFTEIKQCAPDDCDDMLAHFGVHRPAPQEEAWKSRYLLDMDGNALSGRFYAFLKSLSLPFKVAYYREWHAPRIFPWKHFVPLSATTDEYAEVLRYFEQEEEGRKIARDLALAGREWAKKTLRKTDMEVYMFRLLLE